MKYATKVAITAARNLEMLAAAEAGASLSELAAKYGLQAKTIRQILTAERHKRSVSPLPDYRRLRTEAVSG